jgi:hypothetical protein
VYLDATLTLPFVDADRKGGSSGGGRVAAKWWFALAFVVFCALWLFARVNGYWQ